MSGPSCLKEAYILVGVTGYPQNVVGGTSQNQENKGVVKAGTLGWVSREGFLEKEGFDSAWKQDPRLQQSFRQWPGRSTMECGGQPSELWVMFTRNWLGLAAGDGVREN